VLNFEEINRYWEERAAEDSSVQSTTQDIYLREIELNTLSEYIERYLPVLVADVGCGDGRTTARLAAKFQEAKFTGFDYSRSMVENARSVLASLGMSNVKFDQLDICEGLKEAFDFIYTTRCLINLPSWDLQAVALKNIHEALTGEGIYLMVENFMEGHDNFNRVRRNFGLPEIPVREHNLFFRRQRLLDYIGGFFDVVEEVNISSTYYLVSRVIYSKICSDAGKHIDYFDDHHRLAAGLPFCGEFGPVRLLCLRKKGITE
jgi:SAM-dependent methyltransferase